MSPTGQEQLLVHASGPRWRWQLIDRAGRVGRQGECDPAEPNWPSDRPILALMDAASCLGLRVDLPGLSGRQLAQALRWAVEDQLAASAEGEHVVAGPREADGRLRCLVVAEDRLRELRQALGPRAERLLPDALCLPWQPGQLSLAADGERILARWGEWDFGSFEAELFRETIDALAPAEVEWHGYGDGLPAELAERIDQRHVAAVPACLLDEARRLPVNLLSGAFAPGSARAALGLWRWAAAGLAGLVLLSFAGAAVEHYQLKREADRLRVAIDAQYFAAFPEQTRVARHREEAERELARLRFGESAGLLDLINRAAPVIVGQEQIQVDALSYRDGVMELSLRAPDFADLDQLEQRLRALGLDPEPQAISREADSMVGRMRLPGAAR